MAAAAVKQIAEDLCLYARSERHAAAFQAWIDAVRHVLPISIVSDTQDEADPAVVAKQLFARLETRQLGNVLLYTEALPSTQTLLRETLQPMAPSGVVCYTQRQVHGKGRGANTWVAPEGCLTFSFQSSFSDGRSLPFVQYLASLAMVKAVEAVHPFPPGTSNPVRIKWPNDLYAHNAKMGGILCQSEYRDKEFHVTTGIGFNISNREPTVCLQDLLAEDPSKPFAITKEEFLAAFLNVYEEMEDEFKRDGFAPFKDAYLQRWLHTDQVVQVASSAEHPELKVPAVIKGLTDSGCLLAESDDGEALELYPDGNSFDFLSGLLKRKI